MRLPPLVQTVYRLSSLCLVFLALGAHPAPAQPALQREPRLMPGVRVRLWAPAVATKPLIGTVVSVDTTTSIILQSTNHTTQPLKILWAAVKRLEISQGRQVNRRRAVGGAVRGLLGGAVVGVVVAVAYLAPRTTRETGLETVSIVVSQGGGIGAVAGLLIGGVIGAWPREHWREAPLYSIQLGLNGLRRDRFSDRPEGMTLNVSVRF